MRSPNCPTPSDCTTAANRVLIGSGVANRLPQHQSPVRIHTGRLATGQQFNRSTRGASLCAKAVLEKMLVKPKAVANAAVGGKVNFMLAPTLFMFKDEFEFIHP